LPVRARGGGRGARGEGAGEAGEAGEAGGKEKIKFIFILHPSAFSLHPYSGRLWALKAE